MYSVIISLISDCNLLVLDSMAVVDAVPLDVPTLDSRTDTPATFAKDGGGGRALGRGEVVILSFVWE